LFDDVEVLVVFAGVVDEGYSFGQCLAVGVVDVLGVRVGEEVVEGGFDGGLQRVAVAVYGGGVVVLYVVVGL